MAKDKTPASLPRCVSCKRELGAEVGVEPWFVDDCASEGGDTAKHEAFCPRCFVYVRSPREPVRFVPGAYAAVKCAGKCGIESVACGTVMCRHCGSSNVIALPPSPTASS